MGGIQGVDEVGREGRALARGRHGQLVAAIDQDNALDQRLDEHAGLPAVRLHDGKAERRDPGHGLPLLGNQRRTGRQPLHDIPCCREKLGELAQGDGRYISGGFIDILLFLLGQHLPAFLFLKLLLQPCLDLLSGPDVRDPIDGRHDRLLHDLPVDHPIHQLGIALLLPLFRRGVAREASRGLLVHVFDHSIADARVHILRLCRVDEVDLSRAFFVSAQSCIVLQAVARPVHVHRDARKEGLRVATVQGRHDLLADGQGLERLLRLLPPPLPLQRLLRRVPHLRQHLVNVGDAIREVQLVLAAQIGQVDLEPVEAFFAQGLLLGERQDASAHVRPQVVKIWGYRVRPDMWVGD